MKAGKAIWVKLFPIVILLGLSVSILGMAVYYPVWGSLLQKVTHLQLKAAEQGYTFSQNILLHQQGFRQVEKLSQLCRSWVYEGMLLGIGAPILLLLLVGLASRWWWDKQKSAGQDFIQRYLKQACWRLNLMTLKQVTYRLLLVAVLLILPQAAIASYLNVHQELMYALIWSFLGYCLFIEARYLGGNWYLPQRAAQLIDDRLGMKQALVTCLQSPVQDGNSLQNYLLSNVVKLLDKNPVQRLFPYRRLYLPGKRLIKQVAVINFVALLLGFSLPYAVASYVGNPRIVANPLPKTGAVVQQAGEDLAQIRALAALLERKNKDDSVSRTGKDLERLGQQLVQLDEIDKELEQVINRGKHTELIFGPAGIPVITPNLKGTKDAEDEKPQGLSPQPEAQSPKPGKMAGVFQQSIEEQLRRQLTNLKQKIDFTNKTEPQQLVSRMGQQPPTFSPGKQPNVPETPVAPPFINSGMLPTGKAIGKDLQQVVAEIQKQQDQLLEVIKKIETARNKIETHQDAVVGGTGSSQNQAQIIAGDKENAQETDDDEWKVRISGHSANPHHKKVVNINVDGEDLPIPPRTTDERAAISPQAYVNGISPSQPASQIKTAKGQGQGDSSLGAKRGLHAGDGKSPTGRQIAQKDGGYGFQSQTSQSNSPPSANSAPSALQGQQKSLGLGANNQSQSANPGNEARQDTEANPSLGAAKGTYTQPQEGKNAQSGLASGENRGTAGNRSENRQQSFSLDQKAGSYQGEKQLSGQHPQENFNSQKLNHQQDDQEKAKEYEQKSLGQSRQQGLQANASQIKNESEQHTASDDQKNSGEKQGVGNNKSGNRQQSFPLDQKGGNYQGEKQLSGQHTQEDFNSQKLNRQQNDQGMAKGYEQKNSASEPTFFAPSQEKGTVARSGEKSINPANPDVLEEMNLGKNQTGGQKAKPEELKQIQAALQENIAHLDPALQKVMQQTLSRMEEYQQYKQSRENARSDRHSAEHGKDDSQQRDIKEPNLSQTTGDRAAQINNKHSDQNSRLEVAEKQQQALNLARKLSETVGHSGNQSSQLQKLTAQLENLSDNLPAAKDLSREGQELMQQLKMRQDNTSAKSHTNQQQKDKGSPETAALKQYLQKTVGVLEKQDRKAENKSGASDQRAQQHDHASLKDELIPNSGAQNLKNDLSQENREKLSGANQTAGKDRLAAQLQDGKKQKAEKNSSNQENLHLAHQNDDLSADLNAQNEMHASPAKKDQEKDVSHKEKANHQQDSAESALLSSSGKKAGADSKSTAMQHEKKKGAEQKQELLENLQDQLKNLKTADRKLEQNKNHLSKLAQELSTPTEDLKSLDQNLLKKGQEQELQLVSQRLAELKQQITPSADWSKQVQKAAQHLQQVREDEKQQADLQEQMKALGKQMKAQDEKQAKLQAQAQEKVQREKKDLQKKTLDNIDNLLKEFSQKAEREKAVPLAWNSEKQLDSLHRRTEKTPKKSFGSPTVSAPGQLLPLQGKDSKEQQKEKSFDESAQSKLAQGRPSSNSSEQAKTQEEIATPYAGQENLTESEIFAQVVQRLKKLRQNLTDPQSLKTADNRSLPNNNRKVENKQDNTETKQDLNNLPERWKLTPSEEKQANSSDNARKNPAPADLGRTLSFRDEDKQNLWGEAPIDEKSKQFGDFTDTTPHTPKENGRLNLQVLRKDPIDRQIVPPIYRPIIQRLFLSQK